MYVVRRPFRNYGQMMLPGSKVEPGSTKSFKARLRDRVIVEVSAHDFDMWRNYFKQKFGVDIMPEAPEAPEAPKTPVRAKATIKK